MGTSRNRLGPAAAKPADFGTIPASPEQSLTLPGTAPSRRMGTTPQQGLTTAGKGAGGQDPGIGPMLLGREAQATEQRLGGDLAEGDCPHAEGHVQALSLLPATGALGVRALWRR